MLETPAPAEIAEEKPKDKGITEIARTSEKLPGTKIDFLYVTHLPELASKVAEKVKDADLILLEDTGGTREERRRLQDLFNRISAKGFGNNPKEAEVLRDLSQGKFFDLRLAAALAGSGKEIRIVDISSEDPAYWSAAEMENYGAGINSFLLEGEADKALKGFPIFVDSIIESGRLREEHVLDELSTLVPQLQTDRPRRVVIIQGAAHTSVHHFFKQKFPDTSVRLRFEESPLHRYDPITVLTRRRTLFPQKETSEADYARALVGDAIFAAAAERIFTLEDPRQARDFALDLSQKLDSEELKEVLDQFSSRQKDDIAEGRDKKRAFIKNVSIVTLDWAERKGIPIPTN